MSKVYIKQILEEAKIDSDVVVRGWVRTKRNSKNVTFINISDGTTINVIQCVVEAEAVSDDILSKINTGACLEVHGKLIASQTPNLFARLPCSCNQKQIIREIQKGINVPQIAQKSRILWVHK